MKIYLYVYFYPPTQQVLYSIFFYSFLFLPQYTLCVRQTEKRIILIILNLHWRIPKYESFNHLKNKL